MPNFANIAQNIIEAGGPGFSESFNTGRANRINQQLGTAKLQEAQLKMEEEKRRQTLIGVARPWAANHVFLSGNIVDADGDGALDDPTVAKRAIDNSRRLMEGEGVTELERKAHEKFIKLMESGNFAEIQRAGVAAQQAFDALSGEFGMAGYDSISTEGMRKQAEERRKIAKERRDQQAHAASLFTYVPGVGLVDKSQLTPGEAPPESAVVFDAPDPNDPFINIVGPDGKPKRTVRQSQAKFGENEFLGGRQGSGNTMEVFGPNGEVIFRSGARPGETVGSATRVQGLDDQNKLLISQIDNFEQKLEDPNAKRAFGVQGSLLDNNTVRTLMQLPGGEFTVESATRALGVPVRQEDIAYVDSLRSDLKQIGALMRTVTRGVQSSENPSAAERILAENILKGLESGDTIDSVRSVIPLYRTFVQLRQQAISPGGVPAAAIEFLRANPDTKDQFIEKFGEAALPADMR